MSEIPMELLLGEILLLLPVHDLLRYRCVCKLWRDTIDHPSFIQTHLDRQIKSGVTQLILRGNHFNRFYSLSLHSDHESKTVETKYLNHDLFKNPVESYVLGHSCRGIMLVSVNSNKYLWNPFTRQHRRLPPPLRTLNNNKPTTSVYQAPFGLGYYDDDYKVVQIDQYHDVTSYKTYVYSLKLNTWRKIKNFPWQGCVSMGGVFLNGALHYITYPCADFIVALHLGTEDYHVLPLPFVPNAIMYFGVLNGCLVLTCRDHLSMRWDVWLMKDYGVGNSWVKLSSVRGLKPLTYSKDKDGERILIQHGHNKLHWLDLKTLSMREVRICGRPDFLSCQTCVESLVQLDSDVRGVKRLRRQMIRNST